MPFGLTNALATFMEHQRSGGMLTSFSIPEWKWEYITMDIVLGLPRSNKENYTIWVIVDCHTSRHIS